MPKSNAFPTDARFPAFRAKVEKDYGAALPDDAFYAGEQSPHEPYHTATTMAFRMFIAGWDAALAPVGGRGEEGSAEVEAFLGEVRAELIRARSKFPGDRIMTIALAEEFGELCKAILDEPAANVRKEAVQTAVMAARVVLDGDGSVNSWRAEKGLDSLVPPRAYADAEFEREQQKRADRDEMAASISRIADRYMPRSQHQGGTDA